MKGTLKQFVGPRMVPHMHSLYVFPSLFWREILIKTLVISNE